MPIQPEQKTKRGVGRPGAFKGVKITTTYEPDLQPLNYPLILELLEKNAARMAAKTFQEETPQVQDENFYFWAS